MTKQSKKFSDFYKEYGKALDNREAAVFVGAGLSMPAGFKSWQELLREVATDLRLDIMVAHIVKTAKSAQIRATLLLFNHTVFFKMDGVHAL